MDQQKLYTGYPQGFEMVVEDRWAAKGKAIFRHLSKNTLSDKKKMS